ncbi:hypothetical protein [Paludisphaera mucosa]|uniref:Uncharacterized protein n=1 Tax=Paludisphaera mucosa TaxID=3030827 RepID=A0ABT6F747_9BACT|nr:hypothetical protein [Paludisphaera mucosa]MDG3003229.1 hypothetical protein [Paludisphaera mucosa]
MDHPAPILYATTTASGAITLDSFLRWCATPNGVDFLKLLAAGLFTAITAAIALRTQVVQARIERERIRREEQAAVRESARHDQWEAALLELKLARLHAVDPRAPLPADLVVPEPR